MSTVLVVDAVVVAKAWSAAMGALSAAVGAPSAAVGAPPAAVGAPFGRSMVLCRTSGLVSVTDEDGWSGLSSDLADVRRTPRFVARSALMQEAGILAKGEEENQIYLTGVWR